MHGAQPFPVALQPGQLAGEPVGQLRDRLRLWRARPAPYQALQVGGVAQELARGPRADPVLGGPAGGQAGEQVVEQVRVVGGWGSPRSTAAVMYRPAITWAVRAGTPPAA
ncbi:hypothetical protein ACFQYP_16455 [Nonomuraea antimicrobica]